MLELTAEDLFDLLEESEELRDLLADYIAAEDHKERAALVCDILILADELSLEIDFEPDFDLEAGSEDEDY